MHATRALLGIANNQTRQRPPHTGRTPRLSTSMPTSITRLISHLTRAN